MQEGGPCLEALPDEVLVCVLAELPLDGVAAAAASCRRLRDALGQDGGNNPVWKAHACRRAGLPESTTEVQKTDWRSVLHYAAPLPMRLEVQHSPKHLVTEALSACFTGPLGHDRAVRANLPLPEPVPSELRAEGMIPLALRRDEPSPCLTDRAIAVVGTATGSPPQHTLRVSRVWYFEVSIGDATAAGAAPHHHADQPVTRAQYSAENWKKKENS